MVRGVCVLLCGLFGSLSYSCSKKVSNQTVGDYSPAVLSRDAVPEIKDPFKPTRPNGGMVEGKGLPADPGQLEQRKIQNIVQPIVFGVSVGGITLNNTLSEVRNILVYLETRNNVDFYAEHLRILWSEGSNPKPFLIGIDSGYAGKLSVPAPYGDLAIGQSLEAFLRSEEDRRKFLLALGAAFANQPADYDCEKALSCQMEENEVAYSLDFKQGGIRIAKSAGLPLSFIYFSQQPRKFFARPTDPMVYGISIAGATFQTRQATFEARVGPPTASNDFGFLFYDRESLGIRWSAGLGTPTAMAAIGTHQGTLDFGGSIGSRKIGDSFASYAPEGDNGTELLKVMDRALNRRAADFDCLAAEPTPLCSISIDSETGRIALVIDRNSFLFTDGPERRWLQYLITAP